MVVTIWTYMQNEEGKPEEVYLLAKIAMSFKVDIGREWNSCCYMLSLYLLYGVKDSSECDQLQRLCPLEPWFHGCWMTAIKFE